MRILFIAAFLAVSLTACSATSYRPGGGAEGYSEEEVGPNVWRVVFSGNARTTFETVQTYWLYRCAELTQEKGFDGFEIISNLNLTNLETEKPVQLAAHAAAPMPVYVYNGPSPVTPSITAEIKLLKKPIVALPKKIFDASILKLELEPHVKGAKCTKGNVCPYAHQYLQPDFQEPPKAPIG